MLRFQWKNLLPGADRFRDVGMLSFLSLVGTALGLVRTLVLTRGLAKEVFGVLVYATAVVGLVDLFVLPGARIALTQFVGKGHQGMLWLSVRQRLKWYPLCAIAGALILVLLPTTQLDGETQYLILIGLLLYPGRYILSDVHYYLIGKELYMAQTAIELVNAAISAVGAMGLVFVFQIQEALWLFVFDNVAATAIFGLVAIPILWRERRSASSPDERAEFLRYARHQTGINFVATGQGRIDTVLLGTMLSMSTLSDFSLGFQIREQLKQIWMAYYKVTYPALTRAGVEGGWRRIKRDSVSVMVGVGIVVLCVTLLSPILVPIVFSEKYSSSPPYIAAVILGFWVMLPGFLVEMVLRATEIVWAQYVMRAGLLVCTAILTPLLIWRLGGVGAMGSRLGLGLIWSILGLIVVLRIKRQRRSEQEKGEQEEN